MGGQKKMREKLISNYWLGLVNISPTTNEVSLLKLLITRHTMKCYGGQSLWSKVARGLVYKCIHGTCNAQSSQKLVSVYEVTQEGVTCYVRALVPSHTNLVPTHNNLGA